jgi:hypothetical protein
VLVGAGVVFALAASGCSNEGPISERRPRPPRPAIEVVHGAADLLLQHRAAAEVDLMRLDVWARQLLLDAATGSPGEVKGDVATLEAIRVRASSSVSQPLVGDVEEGLAILRAAADAGKLSDAAKAAHRLRYAQRPRLGLSQTIGLARSNLVTRKS